MSITWLLRFGFAIDFAPIQLIFHETTDAKIIEYSSECMRRG